nr:glucomannan 4-beta-mannosyltransferase 2-like [Tanacetum cinerariifolium]
MAELVSGENLIPEHIPGSTIDLVTQFGILWDVIKMPLVVPLLQLAVNICLAMTVMLFMERLYMGVVIILVKLFWKKPEQRYKWEPIREDVEAGNLMFPKVLIQIPMFNEKEVYKISIG